MCVFALWVFVCVCETVVSPSLYVHLTVSFSSCVCDKGLFPGVSDGD